MEPSTTTPQQKKTLVLPEIIWFSLGSVAFWLFQYGYQYIYLTEANAQASLLRSAALVGATFIAASLLSSAVFKWKPKLAKYWRYRRYLGVGGALFILLHILSAFFFYYGGQFGPMLYTLNPLVNPVIFGLLAYPIFFAMAITSTDAIQKSMGTKNWKRLHQLVYVAFILSVFHFIFINPALLANVFGYLLLIITALALFGQLYWWVQTVKKTGVNKGGFVIGLLVITFALVIGYAGYRQYFAAPPAVQTEHPIRGDELMEAVAQMNDALATTPFPSLPPAKDKVNITQTLMQGEFKNLNYMAEGAVKVGKEGNAYVVVFDTNFKTPNGPDLQVYVTKNTAPTTREDIAQGVLIGKLKSTSGVQKYRIPDGINIDDVRSITIHCKAFNVPWAWASLQPLPQ